MKQAWKRAGWVWLALLVLLALTCGSAFVPLGAWNSVANLLIAAIKALLVALFFMHLREARPVYRVVAVAGLFAFALLVSLSLADYSTRPHFAAPWQSPSSR